MKFVQVGDLLMILSMGPSYLYKCATIKTEWHHLWKPREVKRFTRPLGGSSSGLTDGAGLASPLTSWFSTAGRPLSLRWATNPLLPLPVTALTSWSHTGTTVTCSWQYSASLQRNVLAALWGSKKLRACKGRVTEGWGSMSAGSWRCDLWRHDIPWHDFPSTGLLLCLH